MYPTNNAYPWVHWLHCGAIVYPETLHDRRIKGGLGHTGQVPNDVQFQITNFLKFLSKSWSRLLKGCSHVATLS
jgi:hypothetical protein